MTNRPGVAVCRTAFVLFLATGSSSFGQFIQGGIRGGVPLTDNFDAIAAPFNCCSGIRSFTSTTNRYTVGPTVEVALPFKLSLELDALYKRYHYRETTFGVDTQARTKTTSNSWEFPLLLKYKLPPRLLRPFVDTGLSLHHVGGVKEASAFIVFPSTQFFSSSYSSPLLVHSFNTGFVIGGGGEIRAPFVHISPEIRYTRWVNENFRSPDHNLTSSRNQVEFLVGLTFGELAR